MSEIATYQPGILSIPDEPARVRSSQDVAVQRLGEWAQSADAAYTVAQRLVESSFVPASFRGKPIEACAAILAGVEVGLSPMAALRSFDVIQGQAAPRAITLRAVVQSHGHEMILLESTETRCRMKGKRKGSDEWQAVTWTLDRAKALGLTGKDNWKKQPGAMLVARATSELARLIASDAILGIGYSAEEIADGGNVETRVAAETVDATPTGTRRMSRKKAEPEPELREATPGEPLPEVDPSQYAHDAEPLPAGEPDITPAQIKMMAASMGQLGMTDRDTALAFVADVIGRKVESRNDLTKAEATKVIDALQRDLAGTPEEPEL